jgi:hypothetical protein
MIIYPAVSYIFLSVHMHYKFLPFVVQDLWLKWYEISHLDEFDSKK